jgi:hypothetical protein
MGVNTRSAHYAIEAGILILLLSSIRQYFAEILERSLGGLATMGTVSIALCLVRDLWEMSDGID